MPSTTIEFPIEGGCGCGQIRYRLVAAPLVVHCCHCHWCQRETGSAFALNAMIESDRVQAVSGSPVIIDTPSESGAGQKIARCPTCHVAIWSHYSGSGHLTRFVRVGTLDNPGLLPPDVHVFIRSKLPWIVLPDGARAFDGFYDREAEWSHESLERWQKVLPEVEALRAGRLRDQ